jgi:hypothetical protein
MSAIFKAIWYKRQPNVLEIEGSVCSIPQSDLCAHDTCTYFANVSKLWPVIEVPFGLMLEYPLLVHSA